MTDDASSADLELNRELEEHLARLKEALVEADANSDRGLDSDLKTVVEELHWSSQVLKAEEAKALRFGKYVVESVLGSGGQATTYLAVDTDLQRQVVIKVYDKLVSQEAVEAVLNEGRLLARVQSPFVVKCLTFDSISRDSNTTPEPDAKSGPDVPFLVLEYVEGASLQKLLRIQKFSDAEAQKLVRNLAEGVEELHAAGLIHRDIKPGNVILRDDGIPVLIDFGLATELSSEVTRPGSGTVAYMSPEQANEEVEIDHRADIFGLGALLYELVSGYAPFRAISSKETRELARKGDVADVRKLKTDVSASIHNVCSQALARSPDDRFQSARELARALEPTRPPFSRRSLSFLVLTVLGSVLVLGSVWWFDYSRRQQSAFLGLHVSVVGGQRGTDGVVEFDERDTPQLEITLGRNAYVSVWAQSGNTCQLVYPYQVSDDGALEALSKLTVPNEDYVLELVQTQGSGECFRIIASTEPLARFLAQTLPHTELDRQELDQVLRGVSLKRRDSQHEDKSLDSLTDSPEPTIEEEIVPFRVVGSRHGNNKPQMSGHSVADENSKDKAYPLFPTILNWAQRNQHSRARAEWDLAAQAAVQLVQAGPQKGAQYLANRRVLAESLMLAGNFEQAQRERHEILSQFSEAEMMNAATCPNELQAEYDMCSLLESDQTKLDDWRLADQALQRYQLHREQTGELSSEFSSIYRDARQRVLGADHVLMIDPYLKRGKTFGLVEGKMDKCEQLLTHSWRICKESFGETNPTFGFQTSQLAWMHWRGFGNMDMAAYYFSVARQVFEPRQSDYSAQMSEVLHGQAQVFVARGQYSLARDNVSQSLAIQRQLPSNARDPMQFGNTLAALCDIDRQLGNLESARDGRRQILELFTNAYGTTHLNTVIANLRLARIEMVSGDKDGLRRMRDGVQELMAGHSDPVNVITWLTTLASWELSNGAVVDAESTLAEAESLAQQTGLSQDPLRYELIRCQGLLALLKNNHESALELLRESVQLAEKIFGKLSETTLQAEANLADALLADGDIGNAKPLLKRVWESRVTVLDSTLDQLSNSEAISSSQRVWSSLNSWLRTLSPASEQETFAAYQAVIRSRGVVTQAFSMRAPAAAQPHPEQALLSELMQIRRQIADLYYGKNSRRRAGTSIRELLDKATKIERNLAANNASFRESVVGSTDLDALTRALPNDTAILEVIETHKKSISSEDPATGPIRCYDAFVLRSSEGRTQLTWQKLGPADRIDSLVRVWMDSMRPDTRDERDARFDGTELSNQLWQPLQPLVAGSSRLIVIPQGTLATIPWHALPLGDKRRLIDELSISLAGSTREILTAMQRPDVRGTSLLAVGGVNFDGHEPVEPDSKRGVAVAPAGSKEWRWRDLPGTATEVKEIVGLFPAERVTKYSGDAATEEQIRDQLPLSRWVHLATHGFFADAEFRSATRLDTSAVDAGTGIARRNPLILSGLVLSGANLGSADRSHQTAGDGILTGYEITALSLDQTELVVLSACDSGRGETAGSEGLFGIQRAFHIAGARAVMASIWKVDDRAAKALMVRFYDNLWRKGLGKLDALRDAQQAMRRGELLDREVKISDWAGWVLSGDFR